MIAYDRRPVNRRRVKAEVKRIDYAKIAFAISLLAIVISVVK